MTDIQWLSLRMVSCKLLTQAGKNGGVFGKVGGLLDEWCFLTCIVLIQELC